ncbi:MAG: prepilin-type N-terminal cleavage/methylation domain-containing protein [Planctomycetes bacterium]|nr:prepilin-type N-terminal cleavage/methylation domain-containing protein [Planctomycetota bacterium]
MVRKGFTLIELLVVVSLILVLAAIAVIFFPGINEQARAARGGVSLQGWLNVARSTAVRNQAPYGVRLIIDSLNPTIVTSFQYIQQPDDYGAGQIQTDLSDPTLKTIQFVGVDPTGGSANPEEWGVKSGDYLEIQGGGLAHRIVTVTPGATVSMTLQSPLAYALGPTSYYRVQRTPRVATEEILELPDNVGIDINTNTSGLLLVKNPLPVVTDSAGNKYVDILFGPGGDVVTPGVTTASVNLWVRDTTRGVWDASASNFQGDPSIIAIYVRSGLIAAHPPYPDQTQPYKYVDDGRSSGR